MTALSGAAVELLAAVEREKAAPLPVGHIRYRWTHDCSRDCDLADIANAKPYGEAS